MRILITNDDGIYSEGLAAIAAELGKEHEVTVVAPDTQRSACGHSITMNLPLTLQKARIEGLKMDCYAASGTPADCVKLGVYGILKAKPDMIVSGINRGSNIGTDILYSGTVSAALEGAMLGIRSFALSVDGEKPAHYKDAAQMFCTLLPQLSGEHHPANIVVNINFPDAAPEKIIGITAVPQGVTQYNGELNERSHPRGHTYYWLSGELQKTPDDAPDTDVKLLKKGYIVVTPLRFNLTDQACLAVIEKDLQNIHYRNP